MSSNTRDAERKKYFTIDEANAMLPLVRAIVRDLTDLSRDVYERRQRLTQLLAGRNGDKDDVYGEELNQIEEELEKDGQRLRDYVEELQRLGVEPKNGLEGLVDFPTLIDDQPAYLCWKLGEPEVLFWHELEAGFAGRQSLTADASVDAGGESHGHEVVDDRTGH
ncbi:MAG: DUF2203 domain-containing protein [Pirellulales bacterium]|nr:DUF2203 domain-containing protein [Pirellulales bacterium]